jgi:hypothetical protein
MDEDKSKENLNRKNAKTKWLKRFGVLGFLFFLIKGLLWLIIPAVIYYFAT